MNSDTLNESEKEFSLFAQLVAERSNLAIVLLGLSPNPATGKTERDLDGARIMIDQLEMLEQKTKGNLSREEDAFLKQTLMGLRMGFVQAVNAAPQPAGSAASPASDPPPPADPAAGQTSSEPAEGAEEDGKKRFSKKFDL